MANVTSVLTSKANQVYLQIASSAAMLHSYIPLGWVDQHPLACVIGLAIIFAALYRGPGKKLSHIPAAGFQGDLLSFLSTFDFYLNNKSFVERGCAKYRNGIFKVPTFSRWKIIVHNPRLIEDMRNASDNVLSMKDSANEIMQVAYTLGPDIAERSHHVPLVRTLLTRNLPNLFPIILDEVVAAFDDIIAPPTKNDWFGCKPMQMLWSITSRTSNRVFVGLPLCRDPDYIATTIKYAVSAVNASIVLNLTPKPLKPLVSRTLRNIPESVEKVMQQLKPMVETRVQNISEYGKDYPGKPNDFLSWLMDETNLEDHDLLYNLANRILALNFAAIHTASTAFSHTLFWLAAYPEFVEPMREEIQEAVDREGWTYNALNQMTKVDSFIRETMRFNPLSTTLVERTCRQAFQFSDGTVIPKGSVVTAAVGWLHFDEKIYEDPHAFRPFRFADSEKNGSGAKADIVSVGSSYLPFGYGRHACPGRFFASTEMKTMLAHILMTYDVKLEDGVSERPKDAWFVMACLPNPKAHVLFRKRASQ